MYDLKCATDTCEYTYIDAYEPVTCLDRPPCPRCGGVLERAWLQSPAPINDSIDIWIRHGLVNPDGSPKHFTSKTDIFREARRRGLENIVRHVGTASSDKSTLTTRWV